MTNPLIRDRDVEFLLYEVLRVDELCALPAFAEHSRETFDLFLAASRRLSRDVLFPAYRPMDAEPPRLEGGRVRVHPVMREIWPRLVELGVLSASRPVEVGGANLPHSVTTPATGYLMAGNAAAYGYAGLTTGAAHLIEAFGSPHLKETYMRRMYAGEWAGTMALTEPQAGSSLADVRTRARTVPGADYHLVDGAKVFISGGDQDVTDNIVHLALARIEGAPPGIKGVSLFCVPRLRVDPENGSLQENDCSSAGLFHKMGWRGLPSIALNFGERGDCRGWLVGEPHRGITYMFQMMNEARLMVGMNGAATAAVAYYEALEYAAGRPQGRPLAARDAASQQVPIIEHTDVRRMLLRQKAIVEGALALLCACSRYADLAEHAEDPAERRRAARLLDLLTPVAKTFPAERGFESNTLALQVHGGYGYTSEYLPESWLRDQKLNSIHEGTTGIQALDLLGRKVVAEQGAAIIDLAAEIGEALVRAERAGVEAAWCQAMMGAVHSVTEVTVALGARGAMGDREGMLRGAADYMDLLSTMVIAWQWLQLAAAAHEGLSAGRPEAAFYRGKLRAAQYFLRNELPRVGHLAARLLAADDAYAAVSAEEL